MVYQEYLPDSVFSRHVECIWQLTLKPEQTNQPCEVFAPDCTFDIVFCKNPIHLRFINIQQQECLPEGVAFIGQKTSGVKLSVSQKQLITGIRFQAFCLRQFIFHPSRQAHQPVHAIR